MMTGNDDLRNENENLRRQVEELEAMYVRDVEKLRMAGDKAKRRKAAQRTKHKGQIRHV